MKILVIGTSGFIGTAVAQAFEDAGHTVTCAQRQPSTHPTYRALHVDLMASSTILEALQAASPDVVVDCAGVLANTDQAALNVAMTRNLLEAIVAAGRPVQRIIISGSAAEYGQITPGDLPVKETTPLRPSNLYGQAKRDEVEQALKFAADHQLPLTVARIFNPIGPGMAPRMLVPALLRQIAEIQAGERAAIEVSRLDSQRDLLDVRDVAAAYVAIATGEPAHSVYNVGSGTGTSNAQLIELLLDATKLTPRPKLIETSDTPEPLVAVAANISLIKHDLDWQPKIPLKQTVDAIVGGKSTK